MTNLVRFRYVDSYQQILNILLYKKLKKTKFLKMVFLASLIFSLLCNLRLYTNLRLFVYKHKWKKLKKKIRVFFFKRLSKKVSNSYNILINFLSSEINNRNILDSFANTQQLENLIFFKKKKKNLFRLLRSGNKLSISLISSKIFSFFLYKKNKNSISSYSIENFLKSNYGINSKYFENLTKKKSLSKNKIFGYLDNKLDIFLLNFFHDYKFITSSQYWNISINGIAIWDSKTFLLNVGDLVHINNNTKRLPFPVYKNLKLRKFLFIFKLIQPLNKIHNSEIHYIIKNYIFNLKYYFYNNKSNTTSYVYPSNNCFSPDFFILNYKNLLTNGFLSSFLLNKEFVFEKTISLVRFSNTKINLKSDLVQKLDFSISIKKKLAIKNKQLFFLKLTFKFNNFSKKKKSKFFYKSTYWKISYFIIKFFNKFSYLLKGTILTIFSLFNLVKNVIVYNISWNRLYNSSLYSYIIGSGKQILKKTHSLKNVSNLKLSIFKKKGFILEKNIYLLYYPLLKIVSNFKKDTKILIEWNSYFNKFKSSKELRWNIFWNVIFNKSSNYGVLTWYNTKSIFFFIYFLSNKKKNTDLFSKSTSSASRFNEFFRYNFIK